MKPLVTFDLWDTLIRDEPGHGCKRQARRIDLFSEALADLGWQVDRATVSNAYDAASIILRDAWAACRDIDINAQVIHWLEHVDAGDPTIAARDMERLAKLYVQPFFEWQPDLLRGADAAVESARDAGYVVGLISNTGRIPGSVLRLRMAELGLTDYFDFMVFSNEVRVRKPHPGIFRHASEQAGQAAGLHIGDSLEADIEGALAAGWKSIWITPGPAGDPRDGVVEVWPDILAAADYFRRQPAR